jgi:SulP family sulfate permease
MSPFVPKSVQYLRGYTFALFKSDLLAGVGVGIIALPLAMAFAIASGVPPERGLYTAIVAGFLISALGGSRVQIGGPTGAFVVILYDIMQRTGYAGLCTSTLLAAAILILLGLFRLGSWIKYVPHPLIVGFTTGIAVLIFSSQVKDFFGLQMATPPADFIAKWIAYVQALPTLDPTISLLSAGTLALILFLRRYVPKIPWGILAIAVATGTATFGHLSVATIASRFGEIPRSLPWPDLSCFSFSLGLTQEVWIDAVSIAFLGGIESLLCAVVADGMMGGRHRSNCELIAQGIANLGSILFGGIPATGAIARTATSVKMGAKTPVAGMIHALTLLAILLFLAPIVSAIPLCALAAILFVVAWNMSELSHFIRLLRAPLGDRFILLTAFLLTVFVEPFVYEADECSFKGSPTQPSSFGSRS